MTPCQMHLIDTILEVNKLWWFCTNLTKLGIRLPAFPSLCCSRLGLATKQFAWYLEDQGEAAAPLLISLDRTLGTTEDHTGCCWPAASPWALAAPTVSHLSAFWSPSQMPVHLMTKVTDFLCRSPTSSKLEADLQCTHKFPFDLASHPFPAWLTCNTFGTILQRRGFFTSSQNGLNRMTNIKVSIDSCFPNQINTDPEN